jgi:hypothetical protein
MLLKVLYKWLLIIIIVRQNIIFKILQFIIDILVKVVKENFVICHRCGLLNEDLRNMS